MDLNDIKKKKAINEQCKDIVNKLQDKEWSRADISEYVIGLYKGTVQHRMCGASNFKRTDISKLLNALKYRSFEHYAIKNNKI